LKEEILEILDALNIEYKEITHDAVYTIEEMDALGKDYFEGAKICKNLFVRDQKGKRHFLVVLPEEKRAPLDVIATKIGSTRLSFASNERLMKYLKLTPGAVTPLSVINDEENAVEVVLDEELKNESKVGVHPCVNTATVLLSMNDIEKYISSCGNKIKYIKI
jgi:Ala-tRNA(Pro) deacylase